MNEPILLIVAGIAFCVVLGSFVNLLRWWRRPHPPEHYIKDPIEWRIKMDKVAKYMEKNKDK